MTGDDTRYDFDIDWRHDIHPEDLGITGGGESDSLKDVYVRAVRGLGLKLEPRKGSVKVLVVDKATMEPTPN
jgi:uncharacterized protein (TIGR03435 family)